MTYLVDTNILLRIANNSDMHHQTAVNALSKLHQSGEQIAITAQNLVEFHNVATRPRANNGLGLTRIAAQQQISNFQQIFEWLDETPERYPMWEHLIDEADIIGKQVHDTRLVAICHIHHVSHILTFNVKDFVRFQHIHPAIIVVDAASI